MFKLIRDSIFNPKKLIAYRGKKFLFVFFYILIMTSLFSLAIIIEPLKSTGLGYKDKKALISNFKTSQSRIEDGKYMSSKTFYLDLDYYTICFVSSLEQIEDIDLGADFYIKNDSVLVVENILNEKIQKKIASTNTIFKEDVDLTNIELENDIFNNIDDFLNSRKKHTTILFFIQGLFYAFSTMMVFSLISYVFMILSVRAQKYMKKKQLFKMIIFTNTSIIITLSLVELLNLPSFIEMIALFASLIPSYIFEREIMMRIRMYEFAQGITNSSEFMKRYNDQIDKNNKNNNDDDNE